MKMGKALGLIIVIFVSLGVFLADISHSYAFNLPDSDQRKCYQAVVPYAEITCPGPDDPLAQDGSYIINPLSFTDNGNGTVTDNNTGLMWQKQDDGDTYNWYEASGTYDATYNSTSEDVCGSLSLGAYTDWRLPSKKEMVTIVNYAIPYPGPMIDPVFSNTKLPPYWSSTPVASYTSVAWTVGFAYGGVIGDYKNLGHYVRCVRGEPYPSKSFMDNGNGTVTDNKTGLIWQQLEGKGDWSFALSYCEGLTLADQSDWRLPNIKEIESLTDDTKANPSIDTFFFPNASFNMFWSSTTFATDPASAEAVYNNYGSIGSYSKVYTWEFYVRCVRGGQSGNLIIAPSNLTAKAASSSKIVLGWKDNSDNETSFKIERKDGACGSANSWSPIKTAAADVITYTNTGLTANKTYSYRIYAHNSAGDSEYSSCASTKTALAGTPNSPTKLKVTSNTANKVTLTWTDNATNETRFEIYRKMGAGTFTLFTTIESADVKSYADTTATGNDVTTAYSYYIRECNTLGCSPATNSAVVPFKPTVPKATSSTGKINLIWTDKSTNENGFQVYRKEGVCSSSNAWNLITATAANMHAYIDTDVTSGSAYSYKVRAYTQSAPRPYVNGYSMYTPCVSATMP